MILSSIYELRITEVRDRGVPNRECVAMRINMTVDLGQFGIILGVRGQTGYASPVKDNFFWFGEATLNQGDWLFLYTGPGEARRSQIPNTNQFIYSIHWGRDKTLFHNENIVPLLFKMESIQVASQENIALPRP